MGRNILVVEDDKNISDLIHMYLVKEGFDVRIAGDGGKALEEFQKKEPDLILLDIMLPVMDGWAVCAKIRETSKVPIIMLTAKSEVFDRIQGLEMGADDYIVKPFEMKELIARINAVLRRTEIPNDTSKKLHFDKLTIDLDSYELIVDGKKIDTPPKELELLYHLAATPNRVYTRNQLLDEVWGFDYFGDSRTVDVHIKRLREKVEGVSDQWALLALPRRAEVPRQLRILFQTRIPVCRKHLAVGIHVDPRSGGLLQQLTEILQIVAGNYNERPTLYIRIHPRGNRMAERFRIGAVQQRHTLKIHLTELHDESQPFLNAVLLPQSGQTLIEPRADFCLFIAQIHGVVGICRHAL